MNLSKHLTCVLALVLPVSMVAADSASAILYASGTAWINGNSVPKSSAVFVDDLVQTKSDSAANIKSAGSDVIVRSDSLVQLKTNAIALEHGSVTIRTSKGMAAQVGRLSITPAAATWTVFEVTDTDSTIHILARNGDLVLSDGTTLPQGEETTREENRKKKRKAGGAEPQASGGPLNSPIAIWSGVAGIGALTGWVLFQGDDPLSPSSPGKN